MNFFINFIKGIFIGAGAILPGISSGVLCVIFGIYEKLLDSILNFFKSLKQNTKFLLPIFLGIITGVLLFSNLLKYMLYAYPLQTKSTLVGFILSSIPGLLKNINKKSKFKIQYLVYFLFAFLIGIITVMLEKNLSFESNSSFNFFYLILCGFLMSIGIIVPGVSSTIILMILGVYSAYLTSISSLYLPILIPIGIGLIIGSIIFMKITKYFLNNYYAQTFYTIIGFTLGSILVIWPNFSPDFQGIFSFLCMLIGPLLSISFS